MFSGGDASLLQRYIVRRRTRENTVCECSAADVWRCETKIRERRSRPSQAVRAQVVLILDLVYLAAVVSEVCTLAEDCAGTARHNTLHCQ